MKMKKILALLLAVVSVFMMVSLSACGGSGGKTTVTFMYGGSTEMNEMFKVLVDEFNATVGQKQNITIKAIPKPGSLDGILPQQLPSNSGPDVVVLSDEYFKKYTQYLVDLNGKIDAAVLEDFYPTLSSRYHYDRANTTSNSDDPLYGLPAYNDTTVLFYNKTAMEAVGVICISVPEDKLAAFNGGEADLNGKTKADYGIDIDVPAKGFYREYPFVPAEGETDGTSWAAPGSGEVMIFNDQIAMNWDEIEDLGMLTTKAYNSDSTTKYGYYTEWWFNYGWSVGGNCLEDLSGDGEWTFALQSDTPNYIVAEGKTYTGVYTGTVYQAGETLNLKDVINANAGDDIGYKTDSKTYFTYTVNGADAAARDFSAQVADGTLKELPSTKEAFSRFAYLAGIGGLNVCPYPSEFSGTSSVNYFTSGTLAMLVEQISNYSTIDKIVSSNWEWGIAPLPEYKVYEDAEDPDNDTVVVEGKSATHSIGYCISVNQKSAVQDSAVVFLKWMAHDGQKLLADKGYISSRQSDKAVTTQNLKYKNASVVMDCIASAQAGDWWYMPDRSWISTWATPLNNKVRYGQMELEEFLYGYIEESNQRLAEYKQ